jgi:hypothetical protein
VQLAPHSQLQHADFAIFGEDVEVAGPAKLVVATVKSNPVSKTRNFFMFVFKFLK